MIYVENKRGKFGGYINEDFNGVTVGYGQVPVGSVGIIGGATLITTKANGEDIDLLSLDGNAAYGFNKYVFAKGGLNLSKFTKIPNNEFEPSIGAQVGVGIQFNKNIGFDINLTTMRQSYKSKSYNYSDDSYSTTEETVFYSITGIETGLTATF